MNRHDAPRKNNAPTPTADQIKTAEIPTPSGVPSDAAFAPAFAAAAAGVGAAVTVRAWTAGCTGGVADGCTGAGDSDARGVGSPGSTSSPTGVAWPSAAKPQFSSACTSGQKFAWSRITDTMIV